MPLGLSDASIVGDDVGLLLLGDRVGDLLGATDGLMLLGFVLGLVVGAPVGLVVGNSIVIVS